MNPSTVGAGKDAERRRFLLALFIFLCYNVYKIISEVKKLANINQQFLEEYKYLDKLCKEAFDSDKGVTSYIDYMRAAPYEKSRKVSGWDSDLKMLITLRHARNKLAHEVGTLDEALVTREDIEWLGNFYERIMSGSDPISKLQKTRKAKISSKKQGSDDDTKKNIGCIGAIIFFIGIIIMFAVAIFSSKA